LSSFFGESSGGGVGVVDPAAAEEFIRLYHAEFP
jgi:hypothetical protein